jgi:hypothetical protein
MNRSLIALLLGTALTAGMILAIPTDAQAQRAQEAQDRAKEEKAGKSGPPKGDQVRAELGTPLNAAQDLMKQKRFKEALTKINEADALVDNESPFEDFMIEQMRGIVALQIPDLPVAEKAFEKVFATGRMPAEQMQQIMRAITYNYYQQKDYAKVQEWAGKYMRAGADDAQMRDIVKQAQFLGGDMTAAAKEVRRQIAEAEKAGRAPEKIDLELLASVGQKTNDDATYLEALEKLVRYYPTPDLWKDLLIRTQKKPGFNRDRLALDVYRFRRQINLMVKPDDYMDAAQLALQATIPGEAVALVEEGYAKGILGTGAEAGRHQRLRDLANRSVAEDKASLVSFKKEAAAAATGGPSVRLAEALASYGEYDAAVAAINDALKKGGLKNPEDARLRQGTMLLAAGKKAEGIKTLQAVKGNDGAAELAKLWILKAQGR